MIFNRNKDPKRQIGIGHTILDDLKKHPIARPMNSPWDDADPHKTPDFKVWVNPHNQQCFNAMWCSSQDLEQWMEGKGPMVKGKTDIEKKKYWDYAVFEDSKDEWGIDHSKWLIKYTWKHFDTFNSDFNPHAHKGYGMESEIKNRLKLRNNRTKDHNENKIRTEEIIKAMLVPYVNMIVKELGYRNWNNVRQEIEHDLHGIKRTLYCLGYGYMGACNTPEEISNLSWVPDIVYGKGLYLFLKSQNYPLPDFEWLTSRNHYND